MYLLYINYIPKALSDSHTYLHVDDTSIFYQHKDFIKIKNVLNKEFVNVQNTLAVCFLNANLRGESMAMKSHKKIDAKLQFLHRETSF